MEHTRKQPIHITILENMMRAVAFVSAVMMFIANLNPAMVTKLINKNMSLFTSGLSYKKLTAEAIRAINNNWVYELDFVMLRWYSLLMVIAGFVIITAAAFSVGNLRFKRLSYYFVLGGSVVQIGGLAGIYNAYYYLNQTEFPDKVGANIPIGMYLFIGVIVILIISAVSLLILTPKPGKDMPFEMSRPKQLLLMYLPIALFVFLFSYLPLWGWRYAFFDYTAGGDLSIDNFVGIKWFKFLIENPSTSEDIGRVLRNTFIMSGLGLAGSWIPMMFAVLLAEITSTKFKRLVQVFTTIPNFISWVLVYALALAMFSTDGFVNSILINMDLISEPENYLMGGEGIWFKMWAWGTWKGLGWSAIIYIAAISSIDPVLYESAVVDGANRFQKMWYITIPSLLPTYFVLLVLSVAAILSNGMDQYLVFKNASNADNITVLDLYVYVLGIGEGRIPLSTLVGLVKSVVSVSLLLLVNQLSKLVRGDSVI